MKEHTDKMIPFSIECSVLCKATLHDISAHVTAGKYITGYAAARRACCHPGQCCCALGRNLELFFNITENKTFYYYHYYNKMP